MRQLVLRNKAYEFLSRFLGGLLLLAVGLQLFTVSPRHWIFWLDFTLFFLLAAFFITLNFGTLINRLTTDEGVLTIRWNTKIFRKHVPIDEIGEIREDKHYIRIIRKDGKVLRLSVRLLSPDDRRSLRNFLKETTGL
jgi:hypothetical protein